MSSFLRVHLIVALALAVSLPASAQTKSSPDCRLRAALPPLATFGGPAAAVRGQTELGVGVGVFGEEFGAACAIDLLGASDWFTRWRRGVTGNMDLGFDAQVYSEGDGTLTGTTKIATRLQATRGLRLEAGAGAADSGDGRSVNGDLAAVIGTRNPPDNPWNYYAALRLAASHGCGNLLCLGGESAPGTRAPGAVIPLGEIGATARISDTARFVMEAGLGDILSRQEPHDKPYIHFAIGLQVVVGRDRRQQNRKARRTTEEKSFASLDPSDSPSLLPCLATPPPRAAPPAGASASWSR